MDSQPWVIQMLLLTTVKHTEAEVFEFLLLLCAPWAPPKLRRISAEVYLEPDHGSSRMHAGYDQKMLIFPTDESYNAPFTPQNVYIHAKVFHHRFLQHTLMQK